MRIGELAKRAGINIDTVRYYEKAGLLPSPPRRANGYRDYDADHVECLAFIRHCRALDMPLADIGQLLDFVTRPSADCTAVDRLVEDQLARVQARIVSLQSLEKQLLALRAQCDTGQTTRECGILQELVAAAHEEGCVCHPGVARNTGKLEI